MVGKLEIRAPRAAADAARDGFVLRDFHDRLLALGTVPLPTLRASSASPTARGASARRAY